MSKKFMDTYRIDSIRLKGWDYSSPGIYSVTICTQNKICWFGDVVDGEMVYSDMGQIARDCWLKISDHFENTQLGVFEIMPNHVHGLVKIVGGDEKCGDVDDGCRDVALQRLYDGPHPNMSKISPKPGSLSTIIRSYKSVVSRICHKMGFGEFAWQPRFYETIVRNEEHLRSVEQYIKNNPRKWSEDPYKCDGSCRV